MEECLGANLSSRNGHTALIGIHRGKDRRPYGSEEMRELEQLSPHLARALQLRREFAELKLKSGLLCAVIDRLPAGVIILDPTGRSLHCNLAVRAIAARGDGLGIDQKGIPFSRAPSVRQDIERLCDDVRGGGSGGIIRITRSSSGLPYSMLVTPVFSSSLPGLDESQQPYVLMLIHDPSARIKSSVEVVATAFGLPPRTAELVQALVQGETAYSFAEKHCIGANAIKFHLKTAFARTGFRRQSDLAKAVARAIAELGRRDGKV